MVILIIFGGVSCVVGVLIFGLIMGFVYNYVGIVFGFIIIFLLGCNYGKLFIMSFVSDKIYNKYIGWLDNEKCFEWLFVLVIFFLIVLDDVFCLMVGLIKMFVKKFILIILLVKFVFIYLYSFVLIYGGIFLISLLGM